MDFDALDLHGQGIPDFERLNEKLLELTGGGSWRCRASCPMRCSSNISPTGGFPPAILFAARIELDYLEEPDIFHDVFGHVPMLTDPVFADYMQAYGKGGLRALSLGSLANLARLYWYTVEFGLMETPEGLRIYGAGIVSSRTETIFALDSNSPNRLGFDLERVMRTLYRIDDFQQVYFVIPSLQYLLDVTIGTDFGPLYAKISHMPDIPIAAIEPGDKVFTRGTQDYARRGGRLRPSAFVSCHREGTGMRDKVVVVTGGFGVLGYAVAEAALAAGAFVALPGREETSKIAAQDRLLVLGGVDLTDFAAVTQAFEAVVARFGKIDGLANIAGGFRWQTLGDGDLSGWTDQFKMNFLTAVTACKAALPSSARFARRHRQCGIGSGQKGRGGNGRLCGLQGRACCG